MSTRGELEARLRELDYALSAAAAQGVEPPDDALRDLAAVRAALRDLGPRPSTRPLTLRTIGRDEYRPLDDTQPWVVRRVPGGGYHVILDGAVVEQVALWPADWRLDDAPRVEERPRSVEEVQFAAGMRPCPTCGYAESFDWQNQREGARWIASARCPRCQAGLRFEMSSPDDLDAYRPASLDLGGFGASEVIGPEVFHAEIDRCAALVSMRGAEIDDTVRNRTSDAIRRVRICLNELAKFLPPDALAIPDVALRSQDARADRRARPERYTRAWIEAELLHWRDAADRVRPPAPPAPIVRGGKARQTLGVRHPWLRVARLTAAGLEIADVDASGTRLDGEDLAGALLTRVTLVDAILDGTDLTHAVLRACNLSRASLSSTVVTATTLENCVLRESRGPRVELRDATLRECNLDDAKLEHSRWQNARVRGTSLRNVTLQGSILDRAQFVDCDLRGANLASIGAVEATFERCDLRNVDFTHAGLNRVTFRDCKMHHAHGKPAEIVNLVVERADFSPDANGTDVGGILDLLAELY